MTPPTRQETANRFRADFARLLRAAADLSEAQRQSALYGGWTVKDLLAHIAAWDRELARGLDELLAGHRPAFPGYREAAFNAEAVAAASGLSLAEVLAELQSAHQTLVGRIEALTDDEWGRSSPQVWGNGTAMTAASLFSYEYKGGTHYGGHAREIEDWATEGAGN